MEVAMPITVILHIENSEPVVGEVEELPSPTDNLVVLQNPRKRDGKDLHFLTENAMTVVWPIEKLNFIEVVTSKEEEEIIGFVRE
jgi:hypothetical protein